MISHRAGPWLCVPALRPVCPFEDELGAAGTKSDTSCNIVDHEMILNWPRERRRVLATDFSVVRDMLACAMIPKQP
jgi:hypothetical protein